MIFQNQPLLPEDRIHIYDAHRQDETEIVKFLLSRLHWNNHFANKVQERASKLVEQIRKHQLGKNLLDAFLVQYSLSTQEGIALMCLAEALLRVPDTNTVDELIKDKLLTANWQSYLGESHSLFVNAATWGLMLTGKLYDSEQGEQKSLIKSLKHLLEKGSEPIVRKAIYHAMKILGQQFVMAETIQEAIKRSKTQSNYTFSFDMLGEAARTAEDAEHYFNAYKDAIFCLAENANHQNLINNAGISVKLSALHPRYEYSQKAKAMPKIVAKLTVLAEMAKQANISLIVDAEEADRLDFSLDIFEQVFASSTLTNWEGLGLALQSYQKRAWFIIDWLIELSKKHQKRCLVRLIKGAYWDSEIKLTQELGLNNYPVFTRKMNTDVSFLACAQKIIDNQQYFYPMFATHNAHTVAAILEMAPKDLSFEFQCLHGMGQALYDFLLKESTLNCRVYAPVGNYNELLPYLVRRLLENGANTSFVNRIIDDKQPIATIIRDPIQQVSELSMISHPKIPLPKHLFKERKNSKGLDLNDLNSLLLLQEQMQPFTKQVYHHQFDDDFSDDKKITVHNPAIENDTVGYYHFASKEKMLMTLDIADKAFWQWSQTPAMDRANLLTDVAELLQQHHPELLALLIREAGKTLGDAVSELREAIDFCYYYAAQIQENFAIPEILPGPTGELNQLTYHGRGVLVCISPWNFPLAIFTGQIVAALVTGNTVIAKPAQQTSLIAARVIELMHTAGMPKEVVQWLPAKGKEISEFLLADNRIKGVVFTGSTTTAKSIQQTLSTSHDEIIPLIAETGGQNVMIVDSSALPEQVIKDVITSAFNSAGQRCSALRVLYLQDDIAETIIHMLKGAMEELQVDNPAYIATDIGPVIDNNAQQMLEKHLDYLKIHGVCIAHAPFDKQKQQGHFFAPCAYEIASIKILREEIFGPILHVIRYKKQQLNDILQEIRETGYGLTLGIHSRIKTNVDHIVNNAAVGNIYVNRNMVGAVVGVQPFGGEGLSGTGPKAGGPNYLQRLMTERTLSNNIAAAGGNAALMCLQDDEE